MKLQFGILYRDERVADRQDLDTLLGEYATWNAETSGQFFHGPLLMGYRGDKITWEEDSETQPFTLGPYTITFDGRLDNREDIAARVGLTADRNLPDPTLILQAYEKYGDSLLPDLIGEFALVIWRKDTRSLIFCRSIDGSRPLFYFLGSNSLLWSSDVRHLLCLQKVRPTIRDDYVLAFLLADPPSELSPFLEIAIVPPGTHFRFENDLILQSSKLWEPRNSKPVNLQSDGEYEQAIRHWIKEAVRVRLRAKGNVFAELSGGLDSSTVVMLADECLRQSGSDTSRLQSISTIYDISTTCDERYFVGLVENKRGVESCYVTEREQGFMAGIQTIPFSGLPNPFSATPGRFPRIIELMQGMGARVLLTGVGGDHIFCSAFRPEFLLADLLRKGHIVKAHRSGRLWSRRLAIPYLSLLSAKALPLALTSFIPTAYQPDLLDIPHWLNIKHRKDLRARLTLMALDRELCPSQRFVIARIESLFRLLATGQWNAYPALYISHPYTHRPLIEFCLGTPLTQFMRDGETRSLLRRAMREILPDAIIARQSKGNIYEALARAVQRDWKDICNVENWHVCRRGYIDPRGFMEALQKIRMGISMPVSILRVLTIEGFIRSWKSKRQSQVAPLAAATQERFLQTQTLNVCVSTTLQATE